MTHETEKTTWWLFVGFSLFLPAKAVWRLSVWATEMGPNSGAWLGLGLDAGLLVAVLAAGGKLGNSGGDYSDSGARYALTILALAGGLTLLAIRVFTVDGWYSGHLHCCDLSR